MSRRMSDLLLSPSTPRVCLDEYAASALSDHPLHHATEAKGRTLTSCSGTATTLSSSTRFMTMAMRTWRLPSVSHRSSPCPLMTLFTYSPCRLSMSPPSLRTPTAAPGTCPAPARLSRSRCRSGTSPLLLAASAPSLHVSAPPAHSIASSSLAAGCGGYGSGAWAGRRRTAGEKCPAHSSSRSQLLPRGAPAGVVGVLELKLRERNEESFGFRGDANAALVLSAERLDETLSHALSKLLLQV
eukprot:768344-Hanusia_phi.AAC.10